MTIERTPGAEPSPAEVDRAVPHRPSLWRQGDFMKLWTGQTISQFGDEITLLGIPLLAIGILGAGPLEMGILGVVRFLPWIFFTLPAGVWVDRMRRRPILIGADIARAVLLASIPIAFVGDCPDAHPGLRRRLPGRHARGLLRRRLPVVPAEHRRARRAGGGQLEARAVARRIAGGRADRRGLPRSRPSARRSPSPSTR